MLSKGWERSRGLRSGGGVWDAREIYRTKNGGGVSERCTASRGRSGLVPSHFVSCAAVGPVWRFAHLRLDTRAAEQKIIIQTPLPTRTIIAALTRKQYNTRFLSAPQLVSVFLSRCHHSPWMHMTQKAPPGSCGFAPTSLMLSHRNRTPKRRYRPQLRLSYIPQLTNHGYKF